MANWDVVVDKDTCIGCQTCAEAAPNSYKMRDDDLAEFIGLGDSDEAIMEAAQSCPVDAIRVTDKSTGQQLWPK